MPSCGQSIDSAGDGLRADRERAILCVAYEALARRGELVALELRDIDFLPNGTDQALIRRGKKGRVRAGESGLSVAHHGAMAQGLAGACGSRGGGGI